ncbi:unnamed protein product [Brassicogethes aeneus]|uniref:Glycolipid transfer protein domain-containing protein n=1 Tax=Brassicogethes aeneus TaxID=1431903 RepID=A0A9P0ATD6_BRAAE|nr:unnamed protein product [Brassicogethes aeneus]
MSDAETSSDENLTAFTEMEYRFVKQNTKIKTHHFIQATKSLVKLLEKIGKMFAPVVYDLNESVKKLLGKYEQNKVKYKYLEDIIIEENEVSLQILDAVVWIKRNMQFLAKFFQCITDDTYNLAHDLTVSLKETYTETLEPHHGWLGTQLYNVLCKFAPCRRTFLYVLALDKHDKQNLVLKDMKNFVQELNHTATYLEDFITKNNLE